MELNACVRENAKMKKQLQTAAREKEQMITRKEYLQSTLRNMAEGYRTFYNIELKLTSTKWKSDVQKEQDERLLA
eukprot:10819729-Karenia_brevis.AAC.1